MLLNMIDKRVLIDFFASKCSEVKSVNMDEVDDFLQLNNIKIRSDHRDFLVNFGNSSNLITGYFGDCTFNRFKKYNSEPLEYLDGDLPSDTVYFGQDFSDEPICILNSDGGIYSYDGEEISMLYYLNVDSFIFSCLINNLFSNNFFEKSTIDMKIGDTREFEIENSKYKLKDLETYEYRYYLKNNELIVLDYRQGYVNKYFNRLLDTL